MTVAIAVVVAVAVAATAAIVVTAATAGNSARPLFSHAPCFGPNAHVPEAHVPAEKVTLACCLIEPGGPHSSLRKSKFTAC
jgi:hypothetical protein